MNILGLMSGSSLDGLDMALCNFSSSSSGSIDYTILETRQVDLPEDLAKRLAFASQLPGKDLMHLEADFSKFLGKSCQEFMARSQHQIDLIGSHGHTVFHYPEDGFTTQIGNGGIISQLASCSVVCDFRSSDVGAGGLGAPCAPIADKLLFEDIDIFINIGGISNLTSIADDRLTAFDVSPANQILNYLAMRKGLEYDKDGKIAATGKLDESLLENLVEANGLSGVEPRALDNTWVREVFQTLVDGSNLEDAMRTFVDFICLEIGKAINLLQLESNDKQIMVTGGGAFNKFMMSRLNEVLSLQGCRLKKVSREIINYKEAVLIALMAYLRIQHIPNVLMEVTGSSRNTIGGCIYEY